MCNLCCLGPLSTSSVFSCMVDAQSNAMFVSLDFKLYIWNVNESSKSLEICIFEIFYKMIWFAPWWFLTLVTQQCRPKTEKKSTTFYADFKKVSKKFLTTVTTQWESEATPSATPFFKRAYKISHPPQL